MNYELYLAIALNYGERAAELCRDQILSDCIFQINTGNNYSDWHLEALEYLASKQESIKNNDIVALIFEMAAKARERSHGAAILSKVFLNNDLYIKLLDDAGVADAKKCVIARSEVVLSDIVTSKYPIIGICQSKFDVISSDLLVIVGELNAN